MISNLSLSAFSATDLRPATPRPPAQRPPVEPAPQVDRVRAQAEARPAQGPLSLGTTPPAPPSGRPAPRGSLLDLSV
jgi:hypothetical protein